MLIHDPQKYELYAQKGDELLSGICNCASAAQLSTDELAAAAREYLMQGGMTESDVGRLIDALS